jgi:hypothetical protein
MTYASRKIEHLWQLGKQSGVTVSRLYQNITAEWLAVSQAEKAQPFVIERERVQEGRDLNRRKRQSKERTTESPDSEQAPTPVDKSLTE